MHIVDALFVGGGCHDDGGEVENWKVWAQMCKNWNENMQEIVRVQDGKCWGGNASVKVKKWEMEWKVQGVENF